MTTAGSTCLLLVGDRVVLRANAPPDAEYALFELGEIELRASEPGRVREHGYQTTAEQARARLSHLGLTAGLARDVASAMQPVLPDAYARGAAVRRVARYLGAFELFQSDTYDGAQHVYRGVFLDLAALARDLELEHASATLHALYLATVLDAEAEDTTILLSTDACTKGGKPGARTYKRPTFAEPARLLDAASALSRRRPRPSIEEALPRADVIAFLRARADATAEEDARALYKALEGSVMLREMPERGPLATADLWAIESRFESGELEGLGDAIDDAERRHGRTPGTTYLRARHALMQHLEPPKLIAERISALALSLTSFQELGLLAAEAWLEAGEPRRAMPYARDLVDATGVDEGLLLRAQRLLARAVGAAPQKRVETLTDSVPAPQPSRPPSLPAPPFAMPFPALASELKVDEIDVDELLPPTFPPEPPTMTGRASSPLPPPVPPPRLPPPLPTTRSAVPRAAVPSLPTPPPPTLDLPPGASFTIDLPGPDLGPLPEPAAPPPPRSGSGSIPSTPTKTTAPPRRPRLSGVMMETRPPSGFDPRAEPDEPPPRRPSTGVRPEMPTPTVDLGPEVSPKASRQPERLKDSEFPGPKRPRRSGASLDPPAPHATVPQPEPRASPASKPPAPSRRARANEPTLPPEALAGVTGIDDGAPSYMHGATLPPYRLESPAPLLPRAPLFPRLAGPADELAEHLSLPPGLGGEPRSVDVLPTSILEARVQFTLFARELGLDYRLKRGIELRADVSGIEAMQSVLLESFPDRVVRTSDDAYELRRHGAFLSEILARRLEAEWLDISPNELGTWAMIVPPDTRVWPFGRVARFVAMAHRERDLVSYFFELQGRARGR